MEELAGWPLAALTPSRFSPRRVAVAVRRHSRVASRPVARPAVRSRSAAVRRRTHSFLARPARRAARTCDADDCQIGPVRHRKRIPGSTTSPSPSRLQDNKLFTVKLKPYKFHDGTEVKAKNFVDAWNYTAYGPNGQANSYFYGPVAGYADTQCPDADCKQKPKAKTMSGLKVVDDKTFTIQTTEPVSNLPVRLGYSAFAPLPDSFFADQRPSRRSRSGPGRSSWRARPTPSIVLVQVRRLRGDHQAQRGQIDASGFIRIRRPHTPTQSPAASTTSTRATFRRTSSWATRTRATSRIVATQRESGRISWSRSRQGIRS